MLPSLGLFNKKVPFDEIFKENQLNGDLRGKNVFVTGGTNGIGASIAVGFAIRGANVHIAGRSTASANKVLAQCKDLSQYQDANQTFMFHSFDASSLEDNKRLASEAADLFGAAGGLDFLVMTQGGIGDFGTRRQTADGHEWFLSIHDFSRYIIAATLLPILKQSGHGVVIDVLSAGVWNKFDEDDLEMLNHSANFFNIAARDGPVHEIMTQEFNERCPEVVYNHIYPGPINTGVASGKGAKFLIALGFSAAARIVGQTAEQFREIVFNVATKWQDNRTPTEAGRTWGAHGEKVEIRDYPRRKEVRQKVWTFLEVQTGVVIAS